jgi:hypothetical protein
MLRPPPRPQQPASPIRPSLARSPQPQPQPHTATRHTPSPPPFAAPPRASSLDAHQPNSPQSPTTAELTDYKHLGVRVHRRKHAKSVPGTIRTPTMLSRLKECTTSLPERCRGQATPLDFANHLRLVMRMMSERRAVRIRAHLSRTRWPPIMGAPNTRVPKSMNSKPAGARAARHHSKHIKGSVPFSKAQLTSPQLVQAVVCSAGAARKAHHPEQPQEQLVAKLVT